MLIFFILLAFILICVFAGMELAFGGDHALIAEQKEDFERKFPPISDKEFLSLCSPGTNPIVALEVRRVISDSLGIEYARVHPSASLINDYGGC